MTVNTSPALKRQSTVTLLSTDRLHTVLKYLEGKGSYTPFGYSSGITAKSGFTGAHCERSTLGYLLGNGYRLYLPGILRFGGPDAISPFGDGGVNAYGYCAADPINHHDSGGHFKQLLEPLFSFLSDTKEVARHSLVPGKTIIDAAKVTRRLRLDELIGAESRSHFTEAVKMVNSNQLSNGVGDLSVQKFHQYAALTSATDQGTIGITYAFASSSVGWLRGGSTKPAENLVGGAFNFAGALVSGSIEHTYYKTGSAFRRVPGLPETRVTVRQ